jgi:hypothetical protein
MLGKLTRVTLPAQLALQRASRRQRFAIQNANPAERVAFYRYILALSSANAAEAGSCTKLSRMTPAPTAITQRARHAAMNTRIEFLLFLTTIDPSKP